MIFGPKHLYLLSIRGLASVLRRVGQAFEVAPQFLSTTMVVGHVKIIIRQFTKTRPDETLVQVKLVQEGCYTYLLCVPVHTC